MNCPKCTRENKDSAKFCVECGGNLKHETESKPNSDGRRQAERKYAEGKSPILSCILSLVIVGVGQIYNGDVKKGILMFIGAVIGGICTCWAGGFLWLAMAIWSAIDAYRVAAKDAPLWR